MIIFSNEECIQWANFHKITLNDRLSPNRCNNTPYRLSGKIPSSTSSLMWLMRRIEASLIIESQCLVWISDWSIFPSNDNFQLFYRYRQSYGNNKLLSEAPGHLCMSYERAEIVSLAWLCVLQGWDAHIIPDQGYSSVFLSHDEWFELGFSERSIAVDCQKEFAEAKIDLQLKDSQQ